MCDVKYCKQKDLVVIYYGKEVCGKHWHEHCDEENKFDLKKEFGIENESKRTYTKIKRV